jgi:hypothetical protein
VGVGVRGVEVVDVTCRNERQAALRGELGERLQDRLLHVEAGVLQLDVDVVAPEQLDEPVELGLGVGGPALDERTRDPPGQAARQRDQPRRVLPEELPVDPRLVVVALEVAERAELDEVPVADVVGGEERQVRVALVLLAAVVDHIDLAADDRPDALVLRRLEELDRARHRAVVGQGHRRHLELRGLPRKRRDPAGPVEDRVLGVDVQVDERDAHGKAIVVRRSAGQTCRICR